MFIHLTFAEAQTSRSAFYTRAIRGPGDPCRGDWKKLLKERYTGKRSTKRSTISSFALDCKERRSSNIPEVPATRLYSRPPTLSSVLSPGSSLFTRNAGVPSRARTVRSSLFSHPFALSPPRSLTAAGSTRRCDTRSTALPRSLTRTRAPGSNTESTGERRERVARIPTPSSTDPRGAFKGLRRKER